MSHMSIIKPSKDNKDVLGGDHFFIGDLDSEDISDDENGCYVISESSEIEEDPFNDEIEWGMKSTIEPAHRGYQSREREGFDQRVHHA